MWLPNSLAITTNTLTAIVCSAIAFLVVLQLHRDRKTMYLARLMLNLAASRYIVVMMRLTAISGHDIHDLFVVAAILVGCLPYSLFTFVAEYLDAWTVGRRRMERITLVMIALLTISWLIESVFDIPLILQGDVYIAPDSSVMYQHGPLIPVAAGIILCGELCLLLTLGIVIPRYRREPTQLNKRLTIGIVVLTLGMVIIPIPVLEHYAFEQIFYTVGSIILVGPVLRQRLFDPLTQLNQRLFRRATQLSTITRVGREATVILDLESLLKAVVAEIQTAFGYYGVVIRLVDNTGENLVVRAATGTKGGEFAANDSQLRIDNSTLAGTSALSRQLGYVEDRSKDPHHDGVKNGKILSEVSIPLVTGASNEPKEILIGVLSIYSSKARGFDQDDIEVLQILARQLAAAIQNAQLFDEIQRATAAKTHFINYISHEFRNPVNNVLQNVEAMLSFPTFYNGVPLPDEYKEDLQIIYDSTHQLKHLINDILDLSKIEAGKLELALKPCNAIPVLGQAQKETAPLLKPDVRFETNYPMDLPPVLGDDLRLKQVLLNLLSNACKFTKEGSITLSAQQVEGNLRFSIADTGRGIAPEEQLKLFRQFAQANKDIVREYGGTGLGLSISQQLVHLMGGDIWFESQLGQGTTFFFTLPLAETTLPVHQNAG